MTRPCGSSLRDYPPAALPVSSKKCFLNSKTRLVLRHRRGLSATRAALFQLEFDEFDEGRTGVLHRPRLPGVLPDEIAFVRSHAAIGRSRHHFGQYAAVDVDPESRCRLRDLPG